MKKTISSLLLLLTFSVTGFACNKTVLPGINVISLAVNSAADGAIICLKKGEYSQSQQITLKPNQQLKGLGKRSEVKILFNGVSRGVVLRKGSHLDHMSLKGVDLDGGVEFGVLAFEAGNNQAWELEVENFLIGVGYKSSPNSKILAVYFRGNGASSNSKADPAIWITDSDNVSVRYGRIDGAGNGPGGDGELACYNSRHLEIDGLNVIDSGASGIYLVNCDDATVKNATIHRASEWGIDVVDGSSNFTALNNIVWWSYYAGSVFDESDNGPGTYRNNDFKGNNTGRIANCTGVAVIGNQSNVNMFGNAVSPGFQTCSHP